MPSGCPVSLKATGSVKARAGIGADDDGMDAGAPQKSYASFVIRGDAKDIPQRTAQADNRQPREQPPSSFHHVSRALPPGSWPYLRSEGFNTTILETTCAARRGRAPSAPAPPSPSSPPQMV